MTTTASEQAPGQAGERRIAAPGRANVLGVGISALNLEVALELMSQAIDLRQKGYICVTGVHGVMEAQHDPRMRQILNDAFLCTPDGMPMVWLSQLQGFRFADRVYGPDLMLLVMETSVKKGWKHFFYGGGPGVADDLKNRMVTRFPGLKIVGTYTPPFRPLNSSEESELIAQVAQSKPDMIWVGLSTPKQEKFMAEYLPKLDVTLMLGVGAAFDMHTDRVKQAPRWMQRSGMEWLFRLCQEPRRLGKRYVKNNPKFLFLLICHALGVKRLPLPK